MLFVFPPALPVTGSSMNYCVVAFAIVLMISVIQWFVDGRKNYSGPKLEIDGDILMAQQSPEDFKRPEMETSNWHSTTSGNDLPNKVV